VPVRDEDAETLKASLARLEAFKAQAHARADAGTPHAAPVAPSSEVATQIPVVEPARVYEPSGTLSTPAPRAHPIRDPVTQLNQLRRSLVLAQESARAGRLNAARDLLETSRQDTEPDSANRRLVAEAYGHIGVDLLDQTRTDEARRFAQSGLEVDAEAAWPRVVLGQIAYGENDLTGAIAEWERGLRDNPGDPQLESWLTKARGEQDAAFHFDV
jgi:cytochrome c-type biogenesis protein CcmH/NrfG